MFCNSVLVLSLEYKDKQRNVHHEIQKVIIGPEEEKEVTFKMVSH